MIRVTVFFMTVVTGLFLAVLQTGAMAADLSGQLVVSGSDSMEPLVVDLAKGFMKTHKNVKIIVRGGESGKGIYDTNSGSASIGMVSRALTPQELVELRYFPIAYDGICFITSQKNPVQDITTAQLKEIYLAKIVNWKSVGGNNLPINSLIHYRASSSNKVISAFFGVQEADLKGTVVNDAEAGIKIVSKDPKALFYASTGVAFQEKLSGMSINILSISGKKANIKTISQNSYPLTRPFSLITKGDPSPLANAFISYCQSRAAAHTIRSHYFIKPE